MLNTKNDNPFLLFKPDRIKILFFATLCLGYDKHFCVDPIVKKNSQNIKGERIWGKDILPMQGADNICANFSWDQDGFAIFPFLEKSLFTDFLKETNEVFLDTLRSLGIKVESNFNFENYHKVIGDKHLKFVDRIKHIPSSQFPINRKRMDERISEIFNTEMSNFNPITKERVYHFRIIRPHKLGTAILHDNNPIHRDTWHWEYQNNINIYVGICGSTEHSSLALVRGSHYWNEQLIERTDGGALINKTQYVVPALTASKNEIEMIRPNPGHNEMMVFSPYLLHGGALNFNNDQTRISLEMRFWRSEQK